MLAFRASVDIDAEPLPQHIEALGKPLPEHAEAFQTSVISAEEPVSLAALSDLAAAPKAVIPAEAQ